MGISFSQLNSKQKQAVSHVHGPMLVLAGAGTGKTSVLVHRISRLIQQGHARADEIRAFTFTHKAAREIRERVAKSSAGASTQVHASTFHGYCYELLRECGEEFQLLDQYELWAYLRQRVSELPLRRFLRAANPGKFLSDLIAFFDRCSDELVTAATYAEYVERVAGGELPPPRVAKKKLAESMSTAEAIERCREISAIFTAVKSLLEQDRLLTFGALVSRAAALLHSESGLLARERAGSRFLLIDEFQDSNHAQIELARLLGGSAQNVFAVGDPDQAIYHFRGASSAAFQEFVEVFPALDQKNIINLAENQRSTQNVLDCGFAAIAKNPSFAQPGGRLNFDRQALTSARDLKLKQEGTAFLFPPERVHVVPYPGYGDEAADVAERILELHDQGARWEQCAVLFRSHSNAELLAEEFAARSIPFEVQDTDLFESEALRDLLAWLHCSLSLSDDVSLFRLALQRNEEIDVAELHSKLSSAERGTRLAHVMESLAGGPELLARVHEFAEAQRVYETDLLRVLDAAADAIALSRSSTEFVRLRAFAAAWQSKRIAKTGRLPEFLDFLDLYREAGGSLPLTIPERPEDEFHGTESPTQSRNAVKLLTIHAAKGLEFNHVFVLRISNASFPSNYKETLFEFPRALSPAIGQSNASDEQIHKEEERRLFYVALTRARDTLTLYGKRRNGKSKQASPVPTVFLRELADDATLQHALLVRDPHGCRAEARGITAPDWLLMAAERPGNDVVLSASAIDAYSVCPMKFALQSRWKLPEGPSAALQYGAAMHNALRDFYQAARHGVSRTADETVEIFLREFEQAKIDEELQRKLYEQQGSEQLRQFVALRAAEPAPNVLETEKSFFIRIEDVGIRGRIDRIDLLESGGVRVVDYKTGAPKNDMDAGSSVQLGLYALALRLEGKSVEELVFYNLEDNSTAETGRVTDERAAKLHGIVVAAAEGIRAGEFAPKPGFYCRYCEYRSLCPATAETVTAPVATMAMSPAF